MNHIQQEKELTENILKVVRHFSYFCLNLHVNMNFFIVQEIQYPILHGTVQSCNYFFKNYPFTELLKL